MRIQTEQNEGKVKKVLCMERFYNVSFKWSENSCTYCSNIAKAESLEDVKAHYSKYSEVTVTEATESDTREAERKGKPIVTCEHIEEKEGEEMKTNYILLLEEAIVNAENKAQDLQEVINSCTEEIVKIYNDCDSFKEKMQRKAAEARKIEAINSRSAKTGAELKEVELYLKALNAALKSEVSFVYCNNLLQQAEKIEGAPLHYKKVKDTIEAAAPEGFRAYINTYYGYISIGKKCRTGSQEINTIYCGKLADNWQDKKGNQSEYIFQADKLKYYTDNHTSSTPAEIAEQFKKYIAACKELQKIKEEYTAKCEEAKAGAGCVGLNFEDYNK